MADSPHHPDTGSPPRMPRWVKVSGIVVGVLLLAAVAVALLGGNHGPGRHTSGAAAAPPSGVTQAYGAGGHGAPGRGL